MATKLNSKENQNKMQVKFPNKNWKNYWRNINNKLLPTETQVAWYRVINNIVSTNEKLFSIGLSETNKCTNCNEIDTLNHRFLCKGYREIWQELKHQVSLLKRTDGREIDLNYIFFPENVSFPPQKNNVILWLFAHYIWYVINRKRKVEIQEYREFIRGEYYKICRKKDHKKIFGNMMRIVFEKQGIG